MTNLYQILVESRGRSAQVIRISSGKVTEIFADEEWQPLTVAPVSTEGLESLLKQLVSSSEWMTLQKTGTVRVQKWFGRAGEISAAAHYAGDGLHVRIEMVGAAVR